MNRFYAAVLLLAAVVFGPVNAGESPSARIDPKRPSPPSASPHAADRELQPHTNVGIPKIVQPRRVWADSTGRLRAEAEFLRLDRGVATLRKPDATVLSVPIAD